MKNDELSQLPGAVHNVNFLADDHDKVEYFFNIAVQYLISKTTKNFNYPVSSIQAAFSKIISPSPAYLGAVLEDTFGELELISSSRQIESRRDTTDYKLNHRSVMFFSEEYQCLILVPYDAMDFYAVHSNMLDEVKSSYNGAVQDTHAGIEFLYSKDTKFNFSEIEHIKPISHVIHSVYFVTPDNDSRRRVEPLVRRAMSRLENMFHLVPCSTRMVPEPSYLDVNKRTVQGTIYFGTTRVELQKMPPNLMAGYDKVLINGKEYEAQAVKSAIVNFLKDPKSKGAVIIAGLPGTGKTSFMSQVLYEVSLADRGDSIAVLNVPSSQSDLLTTAEGKQVFNSIPSTFKVPNSPNNSLILRIEDADPLVITTDLEQKGRTPELSALINFIDGAEQSKYNTKFVMTLNCSKDVVDKAVLRSNRCFLNGIIEFPPLGVSGVRKFLEANKQCTVPEEVEALNKIMDENPDFQITLSDLVDKVLVTSSTNVSKKYLEATEEVVEEVVEEDLAFEELIDAHEAPSQELTEDQKAAYMRHIAAKFLGKLNKQKDNEQS